MSSGSSPTAAARRSRYNQSGGRHSQHITRACDACRTRKYKCDGTKPVCAPCAQRNTECAWTSQVDQRRALTKEQLANVNRRIAELEDGQRQKDQENARLAAENEYMKAKCREYGLALPDYEHPSPSLPSPFLPSPMEPTSSLPSTSDNDQGLLSVDYRPRSSSSSFPEGSAPQNKTRRRSAPTALHPHPYAPRHLRAIAPSNPGGGDTNTNAHNAGGHARIPSPPALHITTAPPNNDNPNVHAYDAGAAAGFTTVFSGASALSSPSSPNVLVSGPTDTSFAFGTPSSTHFHYELPSPSSSTYSTNSPSSFDTPSTPFTPGSYQYGPTATTSVFDPPSSPLKPTMPSPFKPASSFGTDPNSAPFLTSFNTTSSFEQDTFGFGNAMGTTTTTMTSEFNALMFERDGDEMKM